MRTTLRTLLAVVIRIAAFLAAVWAFTRVYEAAVPATPGDADLGEGLLAFLMMMAGALVWGAWDGYRRGFGQAAIVWVASGAVTGGVLAVTFGFGDESTSLSQVLAEVVDSGPFLAGLVLVPAVVAAAAAALVRRAASPSPISH